MGKLEQLDFLFFPLFFFFLQFLLACFGPKDESTLEAVGWVISGSSNPRRQACAALDSRSKVTEEGGDVLSPLVVALDDVLHLQGERAAEGEGDEEGTRNGYEWPQTVGARLHITTGQASVHPDAGSLLSDLEEGESEVLRESLGGGER